MVRMLTSLIKLYQVTLSPYFGQQCRFAPTCSHYAIEAINKHGALRGAAYTIRRLSRCHPWHAGGHDPVP
ncbi:MAG: membrane protein insertion efficiency factor YidD [Methylophilaceae bacterium]